MCSSITVPVYTRKRKKNTQTHTHQSLLNIQPSLPAGSCVSQSCQYTHRDCNVMESHTSTLSQYTHTTTRPNISNIITPNWFKIHSSSLSLSLSLALLLSLSVSLSISLCLSLVYLLFQIQIQIKIKIQKRLYWHDCIQYNIAKACLHKMYNHN